MVEGVDASQRRQSGRVAKQPDRYTGPPTKIVPSKRSQKDAAIHSDDENNTEEDEDEETDDQSVDVTSEEEFSDAPVRKSKKAIPKGPSRLGKEPKVARKANGAPAPKRARSGRTPTTRIPKTNGQAMNLPIRPNRPAASRVNDARPSAQARGESDLYDRLVYDGDAPDEVATNWTKFSQESPSAAMVDIVNFILRSAGCNESVSNDDIMAPDDVPDRIGELQANLQEQKISDYPLSSKNKEFSHFRNLLAAFFDALVQTLHEKGLLYEDAPLVENIIVWAHTLSASHIRPFRHTATFIALLLADTMCDIIKKLSDTSSVAERSIQASKKSKNTNKERTQTWKSQIEQSRERSEKLLDLIKDTFDTVFVHRYRDVDPKIRLECVKSLGYWIETVPDRYYDAEYLRYLGWMLADLDASIRLETLNRLIAILKIPNSTEGMQKFIEKFRQRFVEMATRDADMNVRVTVLEVLHRLREAGYLEPDDTDAVGRLVFDAEPKLRKAVATFFIANLNDLYESKVDDLGGVDTIDEMLGISNDNERDPASPQPNWLKLKALVEMLVAYEATDKPANGKSKPNTESIGKTIVHNTRTFEALQSIYDALSEIQQSDILSGYLLYDPSPDSRPSSQSLKPFEQACELDATEESVFLALFHSSIKLQIIHSEHEVKHHEKGKRAQKEQLAAEFRDRITHDIAALVPRLLDKFGSDPVNVTNIIRLEHLMQVETLGSIQGDTDVYTQLYSVIGRAFSTHNSSDVVQEASAAFVHAQVHEELQEIVSEQISTLWHESLQAFRTIDDSASKPSQKGSYSTLDLSQRAQLRDIACHLVNLASIDNCVKLFDNPLHRGGGTKADPHAKTPRNMLFSCLASLASHTAGSSDPDSFPDFAILVNLAKTILYYFMWKIRGLKQGQLSNISTTATSEELVVNLTHQLMAFSTVLSLATKNPKIAERYQRDLATTLMGTFALFATCRKSTQDDAAQTPLRIGKGGRNQAPDLSTLYRTASDSFQKDVLRLHTRLERSYARRTHRSIAVKEEEAADPDAPPVDDDDDDDADGAESRARAPASESGTESESEADHPAEDGDEEEAVQARERRAQQKALVAERALCEFTGKIVLCLLAGVFDGSVRESVQINRLRLGPNYKEIVAYLDPPAEKKTRKKGKAGAKPAQELGGKGAKSAVRLADDVDVDGDWDEEGEERGLELELADDPIEEGDVADLRRRELLEEDIDDDAPPAESGEDQAGGADGRRKRGQVDEEDEIMGD